MLVGQPVTVWSVYQFVCGATVTLVAWYTEWWFKRPVGHWRNCQSVSLYWPVWQSVGHWRNCQSVSLYWPVWQSVGHWRNCQSVSLYWPVGWSLILHWPVEQTVGWSLKELVSQSVYTDQSDGQIVGWSLKELVSRSVYTNQSDRRLVGHWRNWSVGQSTDQSDSRSVYWSVRQLVGRPFSLLGKCRYWWWSIPATSQSAPKPSEPPTPSPRLRHDAWRQPSRHWGFCVTPSFPDWNT